MKSEEIITKFYNSFREGDAEGMAECYNDNIIFEDPAFGVLNGDRAKGMWKMLLSRGDSKPEIHFYDIVADNDKGSAKWVAKYTYGPKKRMVINEVTASFRFSSGKIVEHKDDFNLWKWTRQAMGLPGLLLGWSGFMRGKIQKKTNGMLTTYLNQQ